MWVKGASLATLVSVKQLCSGKLGLELIWGAWGVLQVLLHNLSFATQVTCTDGMLHCVCSSSSCSAQLPWFGHLSPCYVFFMLCWCRRALTSTHYILTVAHLILVMQCPSYHAYAIKQASPPALYTYLAVVDPDDKKCV